MKNLFLFCMVFIFLDFSNHIITCIVIKYCFEIITDGNLI